MRDVAQALHGFVRVDRQRAPLTQPRLRVAIRCGQGPLEQLDAKVSELAGRLTTISSTQLTAMKLVVNQPYDNMGLQSTQTLGPILDGIMRSTPEGREFVRHARDECVKSAVTQRDAPFGDYSQGAPDEVPRRRSQLS